MVTKYTADDLEMTHIRGPFVTYSDHETAIAEARRQERERCVNEIHEKANDLETQSWKFYAREFRLLAKELSKGLK